MVRLTDRPDMTLDVNRGRKTTIQPQQLSKHSLAVKELLDVFFHYFSASEKCTGLHFKIEEGSEEDSEEKDSEEEEEKEEEREFVSGHDRQQWIQGIYTHSHVSLPTVTAASKSTDNGSSDSDFADIGGWSGGAMVPGKLPVPGRPTIWIAVGQGHTALVVGAGGGCLDVLLSSIPFSSLSPSLWEMARYRLKYCLKGPLNPKQPTNQSPTKIKRKKLSDNDSVTSESNETVTDKGITFHKVEELHDQPKSIENASAEGETNEAALERKLLFTIKHSFSNPLREKIRRLFLFIINFGSHVISFNLLGNVFIRNHLLDRRSNILDLLRACVSVTASKPVGYSEFRKALNVPKTMLGLSGRLPATINATKKKICLQ